MKDPNTVNCVKRWITKYH